MCFLIGYVDLDREVDSASALFIPFELHSWDHFFDTSIESIVIEVGLDNVYILNLSFGRNLKAGVYLAAQECSVFLFIEFDKTFFQKALMQFECFSQQGLKLIIGIRSEAAIFWLVRFYGNQLLVGGGWDGQACFGFSIHLKLNIGLGVFSLHTAADHVDKKDIGLFAQTNRAVL